MTLPSGVPDKPYFRIGEVARILGIETHVLRYWESEFPQLKPVRAASKQRLYRRDDLLTLLTIKELLHDQRYTIAGARQRLDELGALPSRPAVARPLPTPSPMPATAPQAAVPARGQLGLGLAKPTPADEGLRREVLGELKDILKLLR